MSPDPTYTPRKERKEKTKIFFLIYLEEPSLGIEAHDSVVVQILGQGVLVDLDGALNVKSNKSTFQKNVNLDRNPFKNSPTLNLPTALPSSSNSTSLCFPL